MAFMLAYLKVPLSWGEILRRTVRESINDNCLGMAAQLAYYFFFGLFPALLFLIAMASYFPLETLIDDMFAMLGGVAPPEALSIITDQIRKISEGEQGGLLTLGMLLALWSTSAAMTSIIDTLNAAYDIEEGRPWWKVRLTAIAPDRRRRAVHPGVVRADPGWADGGAMDRRYDAARQRVRLDVDDPAVAARLPAREHGHRHRLLLRA